MINDVKCTLESLAESVQAEVLYDLDFDVQPSEFYKLKFVNDVRTSLLVCKEIYKNI